MDDHILHGWTITDLDRLAKTAAAAAPAGGLDGLTRYQTAWSAIAEALVTAEDTPTRRALVRVGWQAINHELTACLHARGYRGGHVYAGPASSPRYIQFWYSPQGDDAIDRLVEHLAAAQIGELFTPAEGRAVEALAVHGDHALAAEALGLTYKGMASNLAAARRKFRAAWFAPDTPPPMHGHDRRRGNTEPRTHCVAGHQLDGDNLRLHRRRDGKVERVCRACEAKRGRARREGQRRGAVGQ